MATVARCSSDKQVVMVAQAAREREAETRAMEARSGSAATEA